MVGAREEFDRRLDPAGDLQQSRDVAVRIPVAGKDQADFSLQAGKIEIHQIDGRGDEHSASKLRQAPQNLHIDPSPEGVTGEQNLPSPFLLQHACRGQQIILLPHPFVVVSPAAADAPEIEAQRVYP